jgi:predicted TIM-barrel fold metal-dependent hydrolase
MIAALTADVEDAELKRLDALGVRGVRYTIGHKGAVSLSEMPALAQRIKPFGWHVQLHVMNDGGQIPLAEMEQTLATLPTDVVIDHIGSISPIGGIEQQGFQALLRLVRTGRCWVKLSGAYRVSKMPPPYVDMLPFVTALVEERPDRLVWASDWPHVAFKGDMPNTTELFDLLQTWIPDEATRKMILVDNPTVLYRF